VQVGEKKKLDSEGLSKAVVMIMKCLRFCHQSKSSTRDHTQHVNTKKKEMANEKKNTRTI